ncbi:hypothetical protein ACLOJK_020987, partial [Asimina triloba]
SCVVILSSNQEMYSRAILGVHGDGGCSLILNVDLPLSRKKKREHQASTITQEPLVVELEVFAVEFAAYQGWLSDKKKKICDECCFGLHVNCG